jgi:hypothetical protein
MEKKPSNQVMDGWSAMGHLSPPENRFFVDLTVFDNYMSGIPMSNIRLAGKLLIKYEKPNVKTIG